MTGISFTFDTQSEINSIRIYHELNLNKFAYLQWSCDLRVLPCCCGFAMQ